MFLCVLVREKFFLFGFNFRALYSRRRSLFMVNMPKLDTKNSGALFIAPTIPSNFTSFKPIDWSSASVEQLLHLLRDPCYREKAIMNLARIKKEGSNKDLALQIWNSFNTVFLLLLEVTSVYKLLTAEMLTIDKSNRACNALALLQCLATHPETQLEFLKVKIQCYLFPFLKTEDIGKPFRYLRLMTLGVLGSMVKNDDNPILPVVVHCFLETGIFPLCLQCIEMGDELSQSTASFIVSKMLMQDEGLYYCCDPADRFYSTIRVFNGVIENMRKPSLLVLKNIIQCYLRMSEAPRFAKCRACDILRSCLPQQLATNTFISGIREHPVIFQNLCELLHRVSTAYQADAESTGDGLGPLQHIGH